MCLPGEEVGWGWELGAWQWVGTESSIQVPVEQNLLLGASVCDPLWEQNALSGVSRSLTSA